MILSCSCEDTGGFKGLWILGGGIDPPVVVMSSDSSDEVRFKRTVFGDCNYFVNPSQPDAVKLVWQHVARRKTENDDDSSSPIVYYEVDENKHPHHQPPAGPAPSPLATISSGNLLPENDRSMASEVKRENLDAGASKRRKEAEQPQEGVESSEHSGTTKKPRLIWTPELHHVFVAAVNSLTIEKAVPKKILEYMRGMGVPDLTRENVASHLQKYRMYLRKIENNEYEKSSSLPSQSVSLNGSKESNFKPTPPLDQTSYYIENSNSSCSSTNHLPLQSLIEHERSLISSNQTINNVLSPIDQTHFFDQNMLQPSRSHIPTQRQPPAHDTDWRVHGGTVASFQTSLAPAVANSPDIEQLFLENQRNAMWEMQNPQPQPQPQPVVQALHGDPIFSTDFYLPDDTPHPRVVVSDQYSNVDDGHGLTPVRTNSDEMTEFLNEYFLNDNPTNFIEDSKYNECDALSFGNLRVDGHGNASETNFYVSDASSDPFSFNYVDSTMPNSNVKNEPGLDRRTNFDPPESFKKTKKANTWD